MSSSQRDPGGDELLEGLSEPLGGHLDKASLVCLLPPGEWPALHDTLDWLAELDPEELPRKNVPKRLEMLRDSLMKPLPGGGVHRP